MQRAVIYHRTSDELYQAVESAGSLVALLILGLHRVAMQPGGRPLIDVRDEIARALANPDVALDIKARLHGVMDYWLPTWDRAIAEMVAQPYERIVGKFSPEKWHALCLHYGDCCLGCRQKRELFPDHIVPKSRGGSDTMDNLQPLCRRCNSRKGVKTIDMRPDSEQWKASP